MMNMKKMYYIIGVQDGTWGEYDKVHRHYLRDVFIRTCGHVHRKLSAAEQCLNGKLDVNSVDWFRATVYCADANGDHTCLDPYLE